MSDPFPWQGVLDAQKQNAGDLAGFHRAVAARLDALGPDEDLRGTEKAIERDEREKLHRRLHDDALALLTPDRITEICDAYIAALRADADLWTELRYCHKYGPKPVTVSWVETWQRRFQKIRVYELEPPKAPDIVPADMIRQLSRLLEKPADLVDLLSDRLAAELESDPPLPPLDSQMPRDPVKRQLYVEAVALLVWQVQSNLRCGDTSNQEGTWLYQNDFVSAGQAAFAVLLSLGLAREYGKSDNPARYGVTSNGAVELTDAAQDVAAALSDDIPTAPPLSGVLQAISSMSGQYGRGFNLTDIPARIHPKARPFLQAAQAAGLCAAIEAKNGAEPEFAIWLPFCDAELTGLYRQTAQPGLWADDKTTAAQKAARLLGPFDPDTPLGVLPKTWRTMQRRGPALLDLGIPNTPARDFWLEVGAESTKGHG